MLEKRRYELEGQPFHRHVQIASNGWYEVWGLSIHENLHTGTLFNS